MYPKGYVGRSCRPRCGARSCRRRPLRLASARAENSENRRPMAPHARSGRPRPAAALITLARRLRLIASAMRGAELEF
ncbi:jg15747 [Pararge aegeria aegeria]|uniref:Jg15747 protein n=1 Tax=Pararge aegeria aegeria TaxID=348720 RepID=A0A8S4RKZ8_9NEOP|nr:jg15747 [Pararge aegeria aegeria]